MKARKTIHADLEQKKSMFFEFGLLVSFAIVLFSMELNFKERPSNTVLTENVEITEEEMVPITRQEQSVAPPPPSPIRTYDVINIVENDIEIEEELEIMDTETDQDEMVEVIEDLNIEMEEEESADAPIFMVVEEMPIFRPKICKTTIEGQQELMRYIASAIKYPIVAAENGIQGRVYVSFVVSPKGTVTNVEVTRGVYPALDEEAIRVVTELPEFSPGKQRGKPVRVRYSVPINFVLR